MAQYIDKAALKAEIERLIETNKLFKKTWKWKFKWFYRTIIGRMETLEGLKAFLDTLEVKEVEEEPINKDLEEAARKVGQKYFPDENNIWARPNYEAIAAANAFKEGAKWQEEQIMKNAIEREVKVDAGGYPYIDATELYDYENDKPLAKAGDKIKVLIVKDK